jgi:uncharacterized MnhB-related membrane protein
MKDKVFKSNVISVVVLSLIILSAFTYMFLQHGTKSIKNNHWEMVFASQAIILFFTGVLIYIIAILLDMNISSTIIHFDPDGLNNPIFTALSMFPLCIIMVFFILDGSDFAVAPGLGWSSAIVMHVNICNPNVLD